MAKTFETFVQEERERLAKAREDAHAERQAAQDKLDSIERELAAISAYEQVKAGKALRPAPSANPAQPPAPALPGGEPQSRKSSTSLKTTPTALPPRQIIDKLGATERQEKAKTPPRGMKKNGTLNQEQQRGPIQIAQ